MKKHHIQYQFKADKRVKNAKVAPVVAPKTHESLFPYDIKLIYGDLRKTLILVAVLFAVLGVIAWRFGK